MSLLALSPEEFSALAKGWLAVGTELIVPVTAFVGGVFGLFAFIQGRVNAARLDRHGVTLNQVQREMPPPVSTSSTTPANPTQFNP